MIQKAKGVIFSFVRVLPSYFLFAVSCCIPRNKKLWVFIGWRRIKEREIFAENPKYLYLYARTLPEVRAIWIGMDPKVCALLKKSGYEAYPLHSLQGLWYSMRAAYTFIGGLLQLQNWRLTGGTKVIQLWHGKSVKKTGHNSPYSLSRYNTFLFPHLFKKFYKFIAISEFLSDFITTDFQVPKKDILVTGIPKHDSLISRINGDHIDVDTELNALIERIRATQAPRRLYLYGPTFRPNGSNPLSIIDLQKFNEGLRENGDVAIVSLHPKFSTKDWAPDSSSFSNLHFSQSAMDIYPIMHKFDALITDYSSLIVDFLYMGKPTIIFAYDLHTYEKDMGVYEELWETMPGPKVFTSDELVSALQFDFTSLEHRAVIEKARATLFTYTGANASKRIADAILKDADLRV